MTHPSCLQVVDSISASPLIRIDLDDQRYWTVDAESAFPPPQLRRSTASTLLTDGEQISASAYGNRELRLVLRLLSQNPDQDTTVVQALVRELDKTTNLIRYLAPGTSTPMFFRTYRAGFDNIVWDRLERKCYVTIPAEPFGLGLRIDVGTTTVNQNPAAGSNGCFIDVNSVKGDVETPLLLTSSVATDGSGGYQAPSLALAVRSGGVYPGYFRQAESLTMGTDTTVVADATFSGGSKARITFATNTLTTRLSGTFPLASVPAGAENRGSYRVFARVQTTTGDQTFTAQVSGGGYSPTTSFIAQPLPRVVELGTFTVSTAPPAAVGYESTALGLAYLETMSIAISRATASQSLDVDYILLMPADYRFGTVGTVILSNVQVSNSTDLLVMDAPQDRTYFTSTSPFGTPRLARSATAERTGSLPYVKPGDNRVYVLPTVASNQSVGTLITDTLSVGAYYWPRYLHVRPIAT